jgi:Taurine catabolism dioxygenase TauD, TfdA family
MTAMAGHFCEHPGDRHAVMRESVLRRRRSYSLPPGIEPMPARANDLPRGIAMGHAALDAHGAALLALDRPLSNGEFIQLANGFGTPLPQPNPRTRPWVEDQVILNLRADYPETSDHHWGLLFAENYVMLHTELAARPVATQPRHILLLCVEPSPPDSGGQTVLVSMSGVLRHLTDRQADILRATRLAQPDGAPPFLRSADGREIFAFKDEAQSGIPWKYDGGDPYVGPTDIDDAIRAMLEALYDQAGVSGLWWKRSMLGIIDNHRFFHGRTFAPRRPDVPPRHLRRVRVRRDPMPGS